MMRLSGLNMVLKILNRWYFFIFSLAFFQSGWAGSHYQGEVISTVPGGYQYEAYLDSVDIMNNRPGVVATQEWGINRNYDTTTYCDTEIINMMRYYTARTDMIPSSTPGYLILNDYIDVKVEVLMVDGPNVSSYVEVPFFNRGNNVYYDCTPPFLQELKETKSGSHGRITFLIKKTLINGVDLKGQEVVRLYACHGCNPRETEPLAVVTIVSGIVTVPDKCVINEGQTISIPFDDIPSNGDLINKRNYSKKVPITVKCKGGSFDTGSLNIKLGIQPAGSGLSSFNSDYLGTTRKNLGVALKDKAGQGILPNRFYPIDQFHDNQGRWDLTAYPVARPGAEIEEGEYEATASIVAEFQ